MGEVTADESEFCCALDVAVRTHEDADTFCGITCAAGITVNVQREEIIVAGKIHQRQYQFGQGAIMHIRQLQLLGSVTTNFGFTNLEKPYSAS